MEGQCQKDKTITKNQQLVFAVIQQLSQLGVASVSIAPGVRCSSLIEAVTQLERFPYFFWNDERSAAFFTLGQSRRYSAPVAVITTSGTAVGELFPAVMEAYYSGTPLLVITADRPRHYRGTGAPQAAEQEGLFGRYTPFSLDVAAGEPMPSLERWDKRSPAHINLCLEEGYNYSFDSFPDIPPSVVKPQKRGCGEQGALLNFLKKSSYPLAIVSTLELGDRQGVIDFLIANGIPTYLEAVSGIREVSELQKLRLMNGEKLLSIAKSANYPVDAILRIGGVPTLRLWRDLEMALAPPVLSISDLPFSGLSWAPHIHAPIASVLAGVKCERPDATAFLEADRVIEKMQRAALNEEPFSEAALIAKLSEKIPKEALVYLGNSLPIREWDKVASATPNKRTIWASRGLSGIDGQLSTFYGLCRPEFDNWAIVGDMTAMHDFTAPWILPQMQGVNTQVVVVNNGGGKIFDKLPTPKAMQNSHAYSFEAMAKMWHMEYERWESIPEDVERCSPKPRLIELRPDHEATRRNWKRSDTFFLNQ